MLLSLPRKSPSAAARHPCRNRNGPSPRWRRPCSPSCRRSSRRRSRCRSRARRAVGPRRGGRIAPRARARATAGRAPAGEDDAQRDADRGGPRLPGSCARDPGAIDHADREAAQHVTGEPRGHLRLSLPDSFGRIWLTAALVQVIADWRPVDEGAIYIVTPSRSSATSKTRAFGDWLARYLEHPPWTRLGVDAIPSHRAA